MIAVGIAIGTGVGAAIGVALDNIAIGVGFGIAIGAAIGAALNGKAKSQMIMIKTRCSKTLIERFKLSKVTDSAQTAGQVTKS